MTTVTIHGIARSRAFRCHWAAFECGIPIERTEVGFDGTTNRTPEFLAINPMGQVPALTDGAFAMAESLAINLYLAKKYGGALYPAGLEGEAKAWEWTFLAATQLDPRFTQWFYNTSHYPPERRNPAVAAEQLTLLAGPLDMMDAHLARQSHLIGDSFTIADLNVAATSIRLLSMPDLTATRPHLADWINRCYARPAAVSAKALRE